MTSQQVQIPEDLGEVSAGALAARGVAPREIAAATLSRRAVRPWGVASVAGMAAVGLAVHRLVPDSAASPATRYYEGLLAGVIGLAVVVGVIQLFWSGLGRFAADRGALMAAAVGVVCVWELLTSKLALLPLPYFPGPEPILVSLVEDRAMLFEATWRSLLLLMEGYVAGVMAGLVSGVAIGWSERIRYWGMPLLKVVGPIPATAWIPLAIVVLPGTLSAVALIALAVWFPVTMLTASGVSNVRTSYLDVARTLGAGRRYLVLRVAIPAAVPSIFIGLFMGLGASFLTLVVAESLGVRSGLGWYVSWAQGWAEYGKVYAALLIMAAFFSTIMTVLFKVRDKALVWQKGVIKW